MFFRLIEGRVLMSDKLTYLSGFGNHFATEAVAGALPVGQNSPQKAPLGLYAEQLSGTAFTVPRENNQRSWLYRIRPSVLHNGRFSPLDTGQLRSSPWDEAVPTPEQMRWNPLPIPEGPCDFVEGLVTMAGNGSLNLHQGCAAHLYAINRPMSDRFFYNADGDFLLVPEMGAISLRTEFGVIELQPGEICVVQRGIRFQVTPAAGTARGYICENYGRPFQLPYLGPIGANGLANPRDFLAPSANFEEREGAFELVVKFQGRLFQTELKYSPFDVVAWHGNYAPYKYDLSRFQAVNTVSFDHSDPSIFTVLHSPSEVAGRANVDFVVFPPRWSVAENTFRPPYFHRNCMSEYMGLIYGVYEAKEEGFVPGGSSLHNCMSPHGPDSMTYEKASTAELKPQRIADTLAFMFESFMAFHPTAFATTTQLLQKDYLSCWQDLPVGFKKS